MDRKNSHILSQQLDNLTFEWSCKFFLEIHMKVFSDLKCRREYNFSYQKSLSLCFNLQVISIKIFTRILSLCYLSRTCAKVILISKGKTLPLGQQEEAWVTVVVGLGDNRKHFLMNLWKENSSFFLFFFIISGGNTANQSIKNSWACILILMKIEIQLNSSFVTCF